MSQIIGHKGGGVNNNGLVLQIDGGNKKSAFQSDTRSAYFSGGTFGSNSPYLRSSNSVFDIGSGETFTVGFWINFDSIVNDQNIINNASSISAADSNWFIYFENAPSDKIRFRTSNGSSLSTVESSVLSAGQWYFIVATYDSVANQIKISTNGGSYTSVGSVVPQGNTYGLDIAKSIWGSHDFFGGKLDNIFFYNISLSESEVSTLYNGGAGTNFDDADKTGLVSWWSLNETEGSRIDRMGSGVVGAYDSSGDPPYPLTDFNGTSYDVGKVQEPWSFDYINNLVGVQIKGTTFNGTSLVNRVWEFDGFNDYIDFGTVYQNTPVSIIKTGDFPAAINGDTTGTVEAWIKPNAIGSSMMIWHASAGVAPYSDWLRFGVLSNGKLRGYKRHHPSDADWIVDGTTVLTTGVWYHVVLRQDGTSPKIYVNGVQDNTTFTNYGDPGRWNSPGIGNTSRCDIGCSFNNTKFWPNGWAEFFNGSISQFKYYNRALTPDEIKQNYDSQKYRYI